MNRSILFNCTVKLEEVHFHISLDKSFFGAVSCSVPLHNHADYEIHVIKNGRYAFQIDGREYVLGDGNCVIIGPNVYHSIGNALSEGAHRYCFKFECSAAADEPSEIMECVEAIKKICLFENCTKEIDMVESLIAEFQTRQIGYISCISSLFSQLLLTILRDVSGHRISVGNARLSSEEENRSVAIDEFFVKNYRENVHAAELANLLGLSVRQLNRVILRLYRISFKQKLSQMRVFAAKDLLSDTGLSVIRIAEIIGYNNTGYFIATFKKFTGMTPEQFRKTRSDQVKTSD